MDTILLIGSGDQQYREYVCAAIARTYRLVLFQSAPVTWQRPYVVDAIQVCLDDSDAVLSAARVYLNVHEIRGVLTYDETRVGLAAEIAANLGIAHLNTRAAASCRDKLATRRALALAEVPSACALHVSTLSEAQTAARQIGYPVVLKPRALAGSIGVVRVNRPAELPAAFELTRDSHYESIPNLDGLLVEEYLRGPEVSVDCVVLNDHVEMVTLAKKRLGFAPYFEEVGHVVSGAANNSLPMDSIRAVVTGAHHALGINRGITHTELRLTPTGPRIIEVNARLGGDLIPYLGQLATGVDVATAAADVAVGRWPRLARTRSTTAAIRFFYPATDIRVRDLGIDPSWPTPSWLDRLCWEASPGDVLRLPPDGFMSRLGFAIVTGSNEAECDGRLDEVESHLRVSTQPFHPASVTSVAAQAFA